MSSQLLIKNSHVFYINLLIYLITITKIGQTYGSDDAKRLYHDLLIESKYNKLVRPIEKYSDTLNVTMGIRLSQMIDLDEKNQIMTTNVWLRQEWNDKSLRWDPKEYGNLDILEVPISEIWTPDIVLFNNADGNYEVTLMTRATLHPNGFVVWEPPAIYKSSCIIDVEFFPFDIQKCKLKFGSWTYDGNQVDLRHICANDSHNNDNKTINYRIENGIDLLNFSSSVEWDILEVTAVKNVTPPNSPDITFYIEMRRKTLFYTVNLIIPCVCISFLTVLVFYLPSDSGEKITLCISILLSLTLFFLLLAEIIPPTSIVVPLIGKYLLFTMILVTLSILVTVIVLNVHFRSPSTHTMSPWVRRVFLNILPRLLIMRRPHLDKKADPLVHWNENGVDMHMADLAQKTKRNRMNGGFKRPDQEELISVPSCGSTLTRRRKKPIPQEIRDAIEGVTFIAEHLKNEDQENLIEEDWKYVAMVLDRLFLWIFTIACVVGTFGIVLQAPTLYDDRIPLLPGHPEYQCIQRNL